MRIHVSKMARKRAQQKSRIGNEKNLEELGKIVLRFLPASSTKAMRLDEIELELNLRGHYNAPVGKVLEWLCRDRQAVGARDIQNRAMVDVWYKGR